jgi:MFS family permease
MNRFDAFFKSFAVFRVLRHPALLRLWLAQVIYLSVQFTVSYAMIVLITNLTRSATMVGFVIIALSFPIFLLGAPAGTLVDRMDKRKVLWISNVVRAFATFLFVLALLWNPHGSIAIYLLAFLFSLVGLFFTPAEGAIIPSFVDESELLPALSLYNLTLNVSQAIGLLIFGPLALNLLPTIAFPFGNTQLVLTPFILLFLIVSVLYLIAAALTARLPKGRADAALPEQSSQDSSSAKESNWQHIWSDLKEAWQLVRHDPILLDGLWLACFGSLIMLAVADLATTFVQRLLLLPTSYTALVFAPAGVGLLAGAVLVTVIVKRLGSNRTMIVGMLATGIGLTVLPLATMLARIAQPQHWQSNPLFLLVIILASIIAGTGLDLIIVPSQTMIQEHSPDHMRGRVQALYQALFNGGSIPVILFIGVIADLLGINIVIYVMAASCLLAIVLTLLRLRMRPSSVQQRELASTTQPAKEKSSV